MGFRAALGAGRTAAACAAFYGALAALHGSGGRPTRPLFWLAWLACFALGAGLARLALRRAAASGAAVARAGSPWPDLLVDLAVYLVWGCVLYAFAFTTTTGW